MKAITLQVHDDIAALADAAVKEIADIKAKAGVTVYMTDALPAVVSLAANYQTLAADLKSPDDLAYMVKCLATALNV